jgi:hypothetical protein
MGKGKEKSGEAELKGQNVMDSVPLPLLIFFYPEVGNSTSILQRQ